VAEALAQRGYATALHHHTSVALAAESVALLERHGVEAAAFQADIRDEQEVRRLVRDVHDRFGRLDVVVNAAAIWISQPLEDVTAADIRRHFDTNTLGTFLVAQQAGLIMVGQAEGGCIINIGDWAEVRPYPDYAAYFVSKGAIGTLTRCLAVELGRRNPRVRVNGVLPGPVLLPSDMPEAERRAVIQATLVKREGSPANIAQAVLSLVDNDFITGVCLPVDGGRTVYAPE
jgi:pteridine reductase